MKSAISIGLLALLGLVGVPPVNADPLFADEATLSVTLTGPFRSMARDKSEAPEDVPGQLELLVDGAPQSFGTSLASSSCSWMARPRALLSNCGRVASRDEIAQCARFHRCVWICQRKNCAIRSTNG